MATQGGTMLDALRFSVDEWYELLKEADKPRR